MTAAFVKGLAFGFVLAASVGPMWVLCLRRTLVSGPGTGLASGLGVAAADASYAALAAFGLGAASQLIAAQQVAIGLAGALVLAWLGARSLLARTAPLETGGAAAASGYGSAFLSTFGLTLANPPTLLAFAAVFAALGLTVVGDTGAAALAVLGVFLGSAAWWTALAAVAGRLHARAAGRLNAALARRVNVVSGLALLGFAAWQSATLLGASPWR